MKIESSIENEFIKSSFLQGPASYWIGLTDAETEGIWKWSDGSIVLGYTYWGDSQPNNINGAQNCGEITMGKSHGHYFDAEWVDSRCRKLIGFICEKYNLVGR